MTTVDAATAWQSGVYARLTGDAPFMTLVTGVFDRVKETAARPYVTIGDLVAVPDNVYGRAGFQITHTLHTWTTAGSNGPGNAIAAAHLALLDKQHEALDTLVAGHRVWKIRHDLARSLGDPDPTVRHRVDRYVINTTQEA